LPCPSLLTSRPTRAGARAPAGPAQNWLGLPGAYGSDLLLLLLGPGGVTLLPVLALAGVRLLGGRPAGRIGRALLVAAVGAVLIGMALGLTTKSVVLRPPRGLGGRARAGGSERAGTRCSR
jgi:S-DNA-T family DNA segregation ATPase FtsK/SpoIIIE